MDELITFEKNFEDRLEEYMVVFGDCGALSASKIRKQWSMYLEFLVEPNGWQAVWKIPRLTCKKYDIPFPTVVIVHIEDINFNNLTAEVHIIAVQGDIKIPLTHSASLTKIWPTKNQHSSIDILSIANALDMCRFFYYHLWMPWDIQESDNSDWLKNHLSDRLHFYFSMRDGNISKSKIRKYRSLLSDIKTILEYLGDDGTCNTKIEISQNLPNSETEKLINLHLKIADLKTESEILRIYLFENETQENTEENNWLIFESNCNLGEYSEYLRNVRNSTIDETKFKIAVSLQSALDSANMNDLIIVGSGKHVIYSSGVLDDGVVLKSVLSDNNQVIVESFNENSLLNFTGKILTVKNLTMHALKAQCGIMAQTGTISLQNVNLVGQGESSAQHGIGLLPGSNVELENCHISGFGVGIYVSSFSTVTLNNCTIAKTSVSIKICENGTLNLCNCKLLDYKKGGIHIEADSIDDEIEIDDNFLLKSKINVNVENCIFDAADMAAKSVVLTRKS